MQEQETILETLKDQASPLYKDVNEAFEQWWRNSMAREGRGGMTRKDVAGMAYGAGAVLGAAYPALAAVPTPDADVAPTLKELKERIDRELGGLV